MTDAEKALRAQVKCEMLRLALEFAKDGETVKDTFARAELYTMFALDELKETHKAGPKINVARSN